MHTAPNNLFDIIASKENIEAAIKEAAKGKSSDEGTEASIVLESPKKYIDEIHELLISEQYLFSKGRQFTINEHSPTKKVRIIKKPRFMDDQIVHHAIIRVIKPYILKQLYEHTYGSIPDRGTHAAKRYIERFIRKSLKESLPVCFYQTDIYHYYESIVKDILYGKLYRIFRKDKRLMRLLGESIYVHEESGIPLGYYTSVWYAMLYATDFDHFMTEVKPKDSVYVRFMDDIILLAHDSYSLHEVRKEATDFLQENMGLSFKPNYRVALLHDKETHHGHYLDTMGFKFFMQGTMLRDTNLGSFEKTYNQVRKNLKDDRINVKQAEQLMSKIGLLKHTDSHRLLSSVKNSVPLPRMKRIIKAKNSSLIPHKSIKMTHHIADKMLNLDILQEII